MGDPTLFPREPRRMKQPTKAVLRARLAAAEESAALLRGENAEIRRRLENPGAMIVVASAIDERIDGTYLTDVSVGEHRFGDVMVRPAAAPAVIAFPFEPHIGFGHIRDTGELMAPPPLPANSFYGEDGVAYLRVREDSRGVRLPEGMSRDANGDIIGVPVDFTRERDRSEFPRMTGEEFMRLQEFRKESARLERVSPHLPEPMPDCPPPPPIRTERVVDPIREWLRGLCDKWKNTPKGGRRG